MLKEVTVFKQNDRESDLIVNFAIRKGKFNMKFKIFSLLAISLMCLTANAQSFRKMHEQIHKEQLANNKSRIEVRTAEEMMENEIISRETNISSEATSLIDDLLKEAKTHIGKRYVHATRGPKTFDCSGFSHYVYKQFGYSVSPAVRHQYTQGVKVDRKDARKGDLIFFTSRSSGNNAGHVGIITEVDKETGEISFIHASLKGVKISKVEGYYAQRFIGIKRIIE